MSLYMVHSTAHKPFVRVRRSATGTSAFCWILGWNSFSRHECICMYIHVHRSMYIYIYVERERERERQVYVCIYVYTSFIGMQNGALCLGMFRRVLLLPWKNKDGTEEAGAEGTPIGWRGEASRSAQGKGLPYRGLRGLCPTLGTERAQYCLGISVPKLI